MRHGECERSVVLETAEELEKSVDALVELGPEYRDYVESLGEETPLEIEAWEVSLVTNGLKLRLARDNLAEDARTRAQETLDSFEALAA